ncbi:hypothetical protein EJ05DRAFT_69860 [Pseudovirgaria hyperparasitica]|uniref:Uncharacterized protein n=1 Tax=Pseudovirgaria hyperparasitica TaxID=470096 RepID=A0A6A6W3T5_9PEZI|nr:uncharacterized protein EJ05DRAFT_69860 [Pseudovirgaria hyperparasitica]KAF2756600.1 hypothetical protein EJ05DRAFT_69860 [Pseudovirgaria hyperparasitica]
MKTALLSLLGYAYIQLTSSLPIEEKPGFTPWPLEKRAGIAIAASIFSNPQGPQFGVPDNECRGKLFGDVGRCFRMEDVTVDKFRANRKAGADSCTAPCLFYTSHLSGAAERTANYVLHDMLKLGAVEGPKAFQTIWDLHDIKYYPYGKDLDKSPESRCIYEDWEKTDYDNKINGCQRLYFMAMSKAMAMECKGEVFVMTNADLMSGDPVPIDGIWWQVEFPTLFDGNRPADKKVDKITYIQVPKLTEAEIQAWDKKTPPKEMGRGEYWPNGPGAAHLLANPIVIRSEDEQAQSSILEDRDIQSPAASVYQRATGTESDGSEVLEPDDDGYPYPYSIDEMYEFYKYVDF